MTAVVDPPRTVPADDLTRREVVIAGLGLALGIGLSGCGGDDGDSGAGETRRVRHELGVTDVPASPARTLCVEARGMLEIALALGLGTSHAGVYEGTSDFPPAIAERARAAGVEPLAIAGDGPSLEAVAALEPDLIIGPRYLVEPVYRRLSRIAPTLALPTNQEEPWQDTLRRLGRELGRSDEAAEAIAAYESRRDEIRRRHADAIATARVSIFSAFPGEVALSGRTQLIVQTLYDLGGRVPPDHPGLARDFRELSREQLDLLDGDVLVRRTEEGDRAEVVAEPESNPIYARLPAVRAGRVVDIESLTANIGSVYSALDCLDVLDRAYGLVA